jgi:hypothetical protein
MILSATDFISAASTIQRKEIVQIRDSSGIKKEFLVILDVQVFLRHSGKGRNPVAPITSWVPDLGFATPGITDLL